MGLKDRVGDALIRHKARLHETPLERFEVRVARTVEEYLDAFHLVHVAYVYRGIHSVRSGLRITAQHVLPEATVLVAYENGMLVGTMTLTLDSPAGLPLEHDYPEAIADLRRQPGARLVEYGSLAVVQRCWRSGATTLLNMAAHWLSLNVLRATHCVIGINPAAAPLYRALFQFQPLGASRPHAELRAPVIGMSHEVSSVQGHLARHFRRRMSTGLYPHEHFCEVPPGCVEVPPQRDLDQLVRWKLPRDVFQSLFIQQSDRLETLDDRTRGHLAGWRSIKTLGAPELGPGPGVTAERAPA